LWSACIVVVAMTVTFSVLAVIAATRQSTEGGVAVVPGASATLKIGDVAPTNFELARLGGGDKLHLRAAIAGRPAVINLFASWCSACAAELGAFARVSRLFGSSVAFVGIDTNDSDPDEAQQLLRSAGARYPVGIDTSSLLVARTYGVSALPVTFFVSASGHIADEVLGRQTVASLKRRVDELMKASSRTRT
jgi:thiol-disulfide isomerase/thioredoxin